jgi:hypothetical protein
VTGKIIIISGLILRAYRTGRDYKEVSNGRKEKFKKEFQISAASD